MDSSMDSPFTMGEILLALQAFKITSTPGPDGVTYAALRNLSEQRKTRLLS